MFILNCYLVKDCFVVRQISVKNVLIAVICVFCWFNYSVIVKELFILWNIIDIQLNFSSKSLKNPCPCLNCLKSSTSCTSLLCGANVSLCVIDHIIIQKYFEFCQELDIWYRGWKHIWNCANINTVLICLDICLEI